jgi:hypothetical protein
MVNIRALWFQEQDVIGRRLQKLESQCEELLGMFNATNEGWARVDAQRDRLEKEMAEMASLTDDACRQQLRSLLEQYFQLQVQALASYRKQGDVTYDSKGIMTRISSPGTMARCSPCLAQGAYCCLWHGACADSGDAGLQHVHMLRQGFLPFDDPFVQKQPSNSLWGTGCSTGHGYRGNMMQFVLLKLDQQDNKQLQHLVAFVNERLPPPAP